MWLRPQISPFEFDDGVSLSPHEVFRGRKSTNQWIPDEDIPIPLGESGLFTAKILRETENSLSDIHLPVYVI
jgi:hypothetical protein